MLVTCILVSHAKPRTCCEAIASLVAQTHPHWEGLVVDSGELFDRAYFAALPCAQDQRLTFLPSGEDRRTRRLKAMAPWCFNECFRRGLVRGELVMYLCDDDVLYPEAMSLFVEYLRCRPKAQAMYAGEDVGILRENGEREWIGERLAAGLAGKCCRGSPLDCRVDYLQFCHRRSLLDRFPNREWWPESKLGEHHADGVFMERCGELTPIHPVAGKVGLNRRTAQSTYAAC